MKKYMDGVLMKRDIYEKVYEMMIDLRKNNIHSIIVGLNEEARNFIMYHIQVGTNVYLDEVKEILDLNMEKSARDRGGTVYYLEDETSDIKEDFSRSRSNVYVLGADFVTERTNNIKLMENDLNNNNNIINKLIIIYKYRERIYTNFTTDIMHIRQKLSCSDISVVFIV